MERVWSDRGLSELFERHPDPAGLAAELARGYPLIYEKIDSWSGRFKHTSEHLDHLSDTLEYIREMLEHLAPTP
jgi:hypothetical protein